MSGIHSLLVQDKVLLRIFSSRSREVLCDEGCQKTVRDNARQSRQEFARRKATTVTHPAYSPVVALSEFCLFGHLKREMSGFTGSSPKDIVSEIPTETRVAVYNNWIARLEWIIEHRGRESRKKQIKSRDADQDRQLLGVIQITRAILR
jgi:hypothetical protein